MSEGERRRDEALERVRQAALEAWLREAENAVRELAFGRPEFTTDAVWAYLDRHGTPLPHEKRAMGAVMRAAHKQDGLIEPTERFVKSVRPEHHAGPVRVWRSLVYEA